MVEMAPRCGRCTSTCWTPSGAYWKACFATRRFSRRPWPGGTLPGAAELIALCCTIPVGSVAALLLVASRDDVDLSSQPYLMSFCYLRDFEVRCGPGPTNTRYAVCWARSSNQTRPMRCSRNGCTLPCTTTSPAGIEPYAANAGQS